MEENILYFGDNIEVLDLHFKDESVDLVYLDPPFKSNQKYNILLPSRMVRDQKPKSKPLKIPAGGMKRQ